MNIIIDSTLLHYCFYPSCKSINGFPLQLHLERILIPTGTHQGNLLQQRRKVQDSDPRRFGREKIQKSENIAIFPIGSMYVWYVYLRLPSFTVKIKEM